MDLAGREVTTVGQATTMVVGEASIDLTLPPEGVYAYLLDFTRHPEWVANLAKVTKLSDGPIGVGTVFRAREGAPPSPPLVTARMMLFVMIGIVLGAKTYSDAEITALEPNRRIAWRAWLPRRQGVFNRSEWEIVLEPRDGGTHLTQRFRYSPQTWAARRMVGSAEGIRSSTAINLTALKRRLEVTR